LVNVAIQLPQEVRLLLTAKGGMLVQPAHNVQVVARPPIHKKFNA